MTDASTTRDAVKAAIENAIAEYIHSAEVEEVVQRLGVLPGISGVQVAKVIIYQSIDARDSVREILAGLLSSLHVRSYLNAVDIEDALRVCLGRVTDMKLDQPRLEEHFASLLVYLIQDDTIHEGFLHTLPDGSTFTLDNASDPSQHTALIKEIHDIAVELLESRTPTALLQMRAMYTDIVRMYLKHGNMERFNAALASLNSRHSLHQVVRKCVQVSLSSSDFHKEAASDLIYELHQNGTLSTSIVEEGFLRMLRCIGEVCLDDPTAAETLGKFTARALAEGILPPSFIAHAKQVVAALAGVTSPVPPPMNLLARKSAERSVDGWLSTDSNVSPASMVVSPILGGGISSTLSSAADDALRTASAVIGDVAVLKPQDVARIRSVWGFQRPLSELRKAIADIAEGYCSTTETVDENFLLQRVHDFECSELLADLVATLVLRAMQQVELLDRLKRDLNALCQRRLIKQRYLVRGLVQVIEWLVTQGGKGGVGSGAVGQTDVLLSILVYLAQVGCLPRSFFVDIAPQIEEDAVEEASEASGRSKLDELRFEFIRALDSA